MHSTECTSSLCCHYASQHILSRSSSPEISRVAAGRASDVKNTLGAWLGLFSISSVWLSDPEFGEYNDAWVLVLGFFMFFQLFPLGSAS